MDYVPVAEPRPYDRSPALLVTGASGPLADLAAREGEAAGYRITGRVDKTGLADWLNSHVLPHAVIACISSADFDLLGEVRSLPTGLIVLFETDMIDPVYAVLSDVRPVLLCDPQAGDVAAALALMPPSGTAVFSDVKGEGESLRLRRLTEEVGRIARTLAQLSTARTGSDFNALGAMIRDFRGEGPHLGFPGELPAAADVRDVIRRRRLRDRFFGGELFADPAWDMLLDLFASRLEGKQVSVSSLCIAAAVPPTTALRWISALTSRGMFERQADPEDRRRIYIGLSDEATDAMTAWFNAVDS